MSSANSLVFDTSSAKSFMYIRNRNGPNVETWKTHVLTSANGEVCPLSTTLCFLLLKKLNDKFKMLSDMPFCFNLKIMLSHYVVLICSNLTLAQDTNLNPVEFGWNSVDSVLMSNKCIVTLPETCTVTYGCK